MKRSKFIGRKYVCEIHGMYFEMYCNVRFFIAIVIIMTFIRNYFGRYQTYSIIIHLTAVTPSYVTIKHTTEMMVSSVHDILVLDSMLKLYLLWI